MVTATLKATPTPAGDRATGIRIQRALSQPGAKGKKGVLLWVLASQPKPIADAVLKAAGAHLDPSMLQATQWAARGPKAGDVKHTARTMGAFRGFGDVGPQLATVSIDQPTMSDSVNTAIANATDSSTPDASWASDVASAIQAAGQVYLTAQQQADNQRIFNANLNLALQNKPLIPTNPTAYGLPAPTVNFGLTSTTLTPLLWVAGGIGALILIGSLTKRSR